ncbi:MAG: TldD/PmbA family protein [Acidobacteriota bacterium]
MDKKERKELAKWVSHYTQKNGAGQSSVSISNQREIEIQFRDGKIEKLKESTQNSLNLSLYVDNRYSSHSTNNMEKTGLKRFIEETVAMTKYLSKDKFRALPEKDLYEGQKKIDLKINDPDYSKIETKDRIDFVKEVESFAIKRSDKLISATTGYSDVYAESIKVNSNGFIGERESTGFSSGAEATVRDGKKGRPEDYYYCRTRFFNEMPSPKFLGEKAVDYAVRKIGQTKIDSGKYDMIIDNRAVGRIFSALYSPMSASSLQQKRSFLEGKLGKKIASENLSIIDDPFILKGLGSRHFDGEGLAAKKRTIIEKGILKDYYVDNYYGKKLGMKPNSGSSSNLIFQYGTRTQKEIIKDIKNGIFVTGFIGGNSNPTTGDFSYGIMGLLIKDGLILKPVNEMNITGNIENLWKQLEETGNDPYSFSSWKTPTLHFSDIHFSGK